MLCRMGMLCFSGLTFDFGGHGGVWRLTRFQLSALGSPLSAAVELGTPQRGLRAATGLSTNGTPTI
jgi:hypothetical protein